MLDKWKAKRELYKVYKIYYKKAKSFLYSNLYTHEEYKQLKDICYAIAYVLCEYFNFNYEFYYEFPFSYKWNVAYDYITYYNECKEAYEKYKIHNSYQILPKEYMTAHISDMIGYKRCRYIKGDIVYCLENGCLYRYDGESFINIC